MRGDDGAVVFDGPTRRERLEASAAAEAERRANAVPEEDEPLGIQPPDKWGVWRFTGQDAFTMDWRSSAHSMGDIITRIEQERGESFDPCQLRDILELIDVDHDWETDDLSVTFYEKGRPA